MVKRTSFLLVLAAVLTAMLGTVKCQDGDGNKKCGMNMVYAPCDGSCPKTCQDVSNMGLPKSCTMDCNPGCVCVPGYVLQNGKCIPEKDCPCNNHAHYETCGSACPLTCDNYSTPQSCIRPCVSGCFCDKGYVKSGNACVLPGQCSGATSS